MYIIDRMKAIFSGLIVFNRGYASPMIVHKLADQLLAQFLIKQFDTSPSQYRHIEHMHEQVWFPKNYH